jgi:spoIIIJ-associated protein
MNSLLIGKNANNLRALQHVLMMTLIARNAEVTRVNIDIADYKRQRADKIEHQAEKWISEVRRTGREKILDLNAADRRIVHRFASDYSDIETFSTGEGRERRIHIVKKEL